VNTDKYFGITHNAINIKIVALWLFWAILSISESSTMPSIQKMLRGGYFGLFWLNFLCHCSEN